MGVRYWQARAVVEGLRRRGHDAVLSAGPEDFAQAMGGARAVITNFFHGCVFAVINEKPFVVLAAAVLPLIAPALPMPCGRADGHPVWKKMARPERFERPTLRFVALDRDNHHLAI